MRLLQPTATSLITSVLYVLGTQVFAERLPQVGILFVLMGGVMFLVSAFAWADVAGYLVERYRKAWYSTHDTALQVSRELNRMDDKRLRVFEAIGPLEVRGYVNNKTLYFTLRTPTIDIPWTWVMEYVEKCADSYPYLVVQHGTPDNRERDYIQAFTRVCITNGLALRSHGNQPAKWLVPFKKVVDMFGLEE